MESEYGIKENDLGILKITTKAGTGYGYDSKTNNFVNLESGDQVRGVVRKVSTGHTHYRISSRVTNLGDNVAFRATAGHELIHSYHHHVFNSIKTHITERVAYRYSFDTYMHAGRFNDAMNTMFTAMNKNFWGTVPAQYNIPSPFGW